MVTFLINRSLHAFLALLAALVNIQIAVVVKMELFMILTKTHVKNVKMGALVFFQIVRVLTTLFSTIHTIAVVHVLLMMNNKHTGVEIVMTLERTKTMTMVQQTTISTTSVYNAHLEVLVCILIAHVKKIAPIVK